MTRKWWKEAVVYEIYPKSFRDLNGDGIGDIPGITEKLDYIKDLGANVIWLTPIFKSPQVDNGYDISDYREINPDFGTLDDFKELLRQAHDRGIRVILDMVLNHTLDEHPWFQEARKSKDNPYRDYYIWRPGRDGKEPNNWGNYFYEGRGSAWELDDLTGEYYLHNYSVKMPDLNWNCEKLKADMFDMLKWWLNMGVDGFRLDAVNRLMKPAGLPDSPREPTPPVGVYGYVVDREMCANQPGIHELLREINQEVFSRYDILTVGETGNLKSDKALEYVQEEQQQINMVFHFEVAKRPDLISVSQFKDVQKRWYGIVEQNGWITQYLSNHDTPRQVSFFGNDTGYRVESAKMLAALIHTLPGTPYIYQGEEIGMTNVDFPSIEYYDEKYTVGKYYTMVEAGTEPEEALASLKHISRDNVRTPMQWDGSDNAGFSQSTPWLNVNPNYRMINVTEDLQSKDSIFKYYQTLIRLRRENEVLVYGNYSPVLEEHEKIVAYYREYQNQKLFVVANWSELNAVIDIDNRITDFTSCLCNYAESEDRNTLKPYEVRIYCNENVKLNM